MQNTHMGSLIKVWWVFFNGVIGMVLISAIAYYANLAMVEGGWWCVVCSPYVGTSI